MIREAACSCGQLKVRCDGEPERASVCHCLACQRRTGSAFGVQARYRRERVSAEGRASRYTRTGDSGGKVLFHFCPDCGGTVYWEPAGLPEIVSVAVGAFADPTFPQPERFIYESRRHPWAAVPTTPQRADRAAPVLSVRDVDAAIAHYAKLGFHGDTYGEPGPSGPPIYGFLHFGPVELHVTRTPNLDPNANTSALYLYVADADALYVQWRAAGVTGRLDAPRDTPYGLREIVHVDPDGNLLRIGSPLGARA